jgi:hypothetical protein
MPGASAKPAGSKTADRLLVMHGRSLLPIPLSNDDLSAFGSSMALSATLRRPGARGPGSAVTDVNSQLPKFFCLTDPASHATSATFTNIADHLVDLELTTDAESTRATGQRSLAS